MPRNPARLLDPIRSSDGAVEHPLANGNGKDGIAVTFTRGLVIILVALKHSLLRSVLLPFPVLRSTIRRKKELIERRLEYPAHNGHNHNHLSDIRGLGGSQKRTFTSLIISRG